jgi:hypothetical protein
MKGYTGNLVIQFTATVRSFPDFERRLRKVFTQAEREIGAELWEVPKLIALPGPIPLGYYGVQLCTAPNPLLGQTSPPVPPEWVVVETISEAREAVQDYLLQHCEQVGPGNWATDSGRVWDHQGEVVARFSFDLRCWFATYGGGESEVTL